MNATSWTTTDAADLRPVVLVAGGLLTAPGWYRPLAAALCARGAADVVIARVYPPDWILATVRGLGPITTRVGRALLEAGERSAADPASRGAPILCVGHSAGGLVGRLLTSPVPFEGRRLNASGRIGALVTLGTPHLVDDEAHWGSRVADAGARFANRHVPGPFFAPTTGYLAVGSGYVVGRREDEDARSGFFHRLYQEVHAAPDEAIVAGDGLLPLEATLLPGARHVVVEGAVHAPGGRDPWYGDEAPLDRWWPVALEVWRAALSARQARRRELLAAAEAAAAT